MKQIINKKTYNTETATLIGQDYEGNPSDFRYWWEGLYLTKKGAYFIAGEGGALSKYGKTFSGTSTGGENIKPVSRENACKFCEEHQLTDVIEKHFADLIEEG